MKYTSRDDGVNQGMEFRIMDAEYKAPGDSLSRRVNRYQTRGGGPRFGKPSLDTQIRYAMGNTGLQRNTWLGLWC